MTFFFFFSSFLYARKKKCNLHKRVRAVLFCMSVMLCYVHVTCKERKEGKGNRGMCVIFFSRLLFVWCGECVCVWEAAFRSFGLLRQLYILFITTTHAIHPFSFNKTNINLLNYYYQYQHFTRFMIPVFYICPSKSKQIILSR